MSQVRVLEVWEKDEILSANMISERLGDMTPNSVHKRIQALARWGQVAKVGTSPAPHGGSPRALYRRIW